MHVRSDGMSKLFGSGLRLLHFCSSNLLSFPSPSLSILEANGRSKLLSGNQCSSRSSKHLKQLCFTSSLSGVFDPSSNNISDRIVEQILKPNSLCHFQATGCLSSLNTFLTPKHLDLLKKPRNGHFVRPKEKKIT